MLKGEKLELESQFSEKYDDVSPVRWHLIGHLQTNKVKKAVEHFDLIQSIDSEHLMQAVNKSAESIGKIQDWRDLRTDCNLSRFLSFGNDSKN